jgi:hypothetical protein
MDIFLHKFPKNFSIQQWIGLAMHQKKETFPWDIENRKYMFNCVTRIYIYLVFVSRFSDGGSCRTQKIIKLHILPARIWLSIFLGFFFPKLRQWTNNYYSVGSPDFLMKEFRLFRCWLELKVFSYIRRYSIATEKSYK